MYPTLCLKCNTEIFPHTDWKGGMFFTEGFCKKEYYSNASWSVTNMSCTCLRNSTWGGSQSSMSNVVNTSTIYSEGDHIFPFNLLKDLSVPSLHRSPSANILLSYQGLPKNGWRPTTSSKLHRGRMMKMWTEIDVSPNILQMLSSRLPLLLWR